MLYVLSGKKNIDAYRISLSFVFSFLCIIKILISFFSKPTFMNNLSSIWILGIIFVEIFLLFLVGYMNKQFKN